MNKKYLPAEITTKTILVVFSILTVWLVITNIILFYRFFDIKTNVDKRTNQKVTQAITETTNKMEQKFIEREKTPFTQFVAPEDLGRLSFNHPKNWSVYIERDKVRSTYKVYFNPKKIRPINRDSRYALRLVIENKSYEKVIDKYNGLIKKGNLKSKVITINKQNGTLLEGKFSDIIEGSAVVFKLRDKTVTIMTDAPQFVSDFDEIIKSIVYNI